MSTASPPRPQRPLRLGIVGCGNVLGAYRAPLAELRLRGLAEVVIACGRARQQAATEAMLGPVRFTTQDVAVLASDDLDVVLILTSMNEHARLAAAALRAGKHVLVEKPLATNLPDARALLEIAARGPGHLVCAPFTILSPTFQTLARRLRRGEIGKVCLARARYGWSGPTWNEWFYRPGGGALFDLGVYSLTSLTGLLGPVRRVTAMAGTAVPVREINGRSLPVQVEDNAQVLLDFGDSAFGVVTTGFTMQQYRGPALEIYGSTGTLQMMGDDWDPDGYELWRNNVGAWQLYKETAPDWPWTDGLRHLVECLHAGTVPWTTPEHAYHVLEVMLRAQESSRTGQALVIESSFARPDFGEEAPAAESAHQVHDRTRQHD